MNQSTGRLEAAAPGTGVVLLPFALCLGAIGVTSACVALPTDAARYAKIANLVVNVSFPPFLAVHYVLA